MIGVLSRCGCWRWRSSLNDEAQAPSRAVGHRKLRLRFRIGRGLMSTKSISRKATKFSSAIRDKVWIAANGHCLCTYGLAYTGGTPRQLTLPGGPLWVVPVLFTSVGLGPLAVVGFVAVSGGG